MEWQKVASPNDSTTVVYVGILRKITSGLTAAYIGEDGDGPDWPDALEEFDAHLRSVVVNKAALADALLMKGAFRAVDIRCKDSIAVADYCTCSHVCSQNAYRAVAISYGTVSAYLAIVRTFGSKCVELRDRAGFGQHLGCNGIDGGSV